MRPFSEFLSGMKLFPIHSRDTDASAKHRCMNCVNFSNSPEYLEGVYPGLNVMSSGYASVRRDDGICTLHDLYLSADSHCGQFAGDPERIA